MNVLWISNTIFPDLALSLGEDIPVIGGWMYGLAKDLAARGIQLTVVTTSKNHQSIHREINGISYYILSSKTVIYNYDSTLEKHWDELVNKIQPDVVHIHGTEAAIGLSLMNSKPSLNYVISIQGLISVCARHFLGGISYDDLQRNITFRDVVKQDSIVQAQQKFSARAKKVEIPSLIKAKHVIGRTRWDRAHVLNINPNISYHFCNESLRDPFYDSRKWDAKNKTDYSIMVSSAAYPLKGMHKVLEAMVIVKRTHPKVTLNVVGTDNTNATNLSEKLRLGGYGKYLRKFIKDNGLAQHVNFLGSLEAGGMVNAYLDSHVFICPSSIENSPNSLGEAQILGTPVIGSYVGGVPDMISHEQSGLLYRFEEIEVLAQHIIRIFDDVELTKTLSQGGIDAATARHDREKNLNDLIACYSNMLECST